MKKIGFIDYYIDEWHANNYPKMIRESSLKEYFDVALAWEKTTPEDKKPLDQWCREQDVQKADSIEQVIEECDCIVVLSPDNPEHHEDLADLPLKSGKPVYIDKPIAPSLEAAKRLFKKAEENNTPMMSCSALRFGSALEKVIKEDMAGQRARFVSTRGPGKFQIYAIHQIEMLVMALGTGAKRVMLFGNDSVKTMLIDYEDNRRGIINLMQAYPFEISIQYGADQEVIVSKIDDFFPCFIEAMLLFFKTSSSLVPKQETLEIAALIEAGGKALERMNQWTEVPER